MHYIIEKKNENMKDIEHVKNKNYVKVYLEGSSKRVLKSERERK